MENQPFKRVLSNDYIMLDILKMLSLKEQYNVQKVCQRLRYLVVTCLWKQKLPKMLMHRDQMVCFNDDEFLECLLFNAENVKTLTIYAVKQIDFPMFFSKCYKNLLELHIHDFGYIEGRYDCIATACSQLQDFSYNAERDFNSLLFKEDCMKLFKMLCTLKSLRAVKLCSVYASYSELYNLATAVPLKRLEIQNLCITEWNSNNCPLDLPGLDVLNVQCSDDINNDCKYNVLEFVRKCLNLKELQIDIPRKEIVGFFDKFQYLKIINLGNCHSPATVVDLMRNSNVVSLVISGSVLLNPVFEITNNETGFFTSLQSLVVHIGFGNNPISFVFESPSINFTNLQKLTFCGSKASLMETMNDGIMIYISDRCPKIKELHFFNIIIVPGIFIKTLETLQCLTLEGFSISWSNLFSILHNLSLLEYLDLDFIEITKELFTIPKILKRLGNSLKVLKIILSKNHIPFWKDILNCFESLPNVHTMCVRNAQLSKNDIRHIFGKFPSLQSLQFQLFGKYGHVYHPVNEMLMKWTDILEIWKWSQAKTFHIFDMPIPIDDCLRLPENHMKINFVTIPYGVFVDTNVFWKSIFNGRSEFRLCCTCQNEYEQMNVLRHMFIDPTLKEKLKSIYISTNCYPVKKLDHFDTIQKFCNRYMTSPKLPVCYLDGNNKRLWNEKYCNTFVIIIEN